MWYYYWRRHALPPSYFNDMKRERPGEYRIVRAFYEQERDDLQELLKKGGDGIIPAIDFFQADVSVKRGD